ncbi:MAG: FHA domain-containing protein [Lachnospiraceae bacterium]|nr:FHA domain-containing protein [Lachnospiraceae bacterium]
MKNLKTNRSVGLYVGLSILFQLTPVILVAILVKKISSGVSGVMNLFSMGNSVPAGGGFLHTSYVPSSPGFGDLGGLGDLNGLMGDMIIGSARDAIIKFMMPFIIVGILCLAYTIYKIVLFWGVCRDINTICGKYNIGGISLPYLVVWLLSGITCNIFQVIWSRLTGKRLEDASGMYQRPIKGTAGSHTAFAVMESLLSFFSLLFVLMASIMEGSAGIFLFFTFAFIISYILSFVGISNMAGFIRDVNVLAEAYNGQMAAGAYGQDVQQPYSGQDAYAGQDMYEGNPYASSEQFTPQNPIQQMDSDMTMPVQEWAPDAENAWKPEEPVSGGMMEGCMGIYQGAQIPIEGEIMIGRDEMSSNIVIKTPEVSRKHCGIRYNPDGTYTVTDYSSNGIYYKNGEAFPKHTPVICSAGTIIVIARSGNEFILK